MKRLFKLYWEKGDRVDSTFFLHEDEKVILQEIKDYLIKIDPDDHWFIEVKELSEEDRFVRAATKCTVCHKVELFTKAEVNAGIISNCCSAPVVILYWTARTLFKRINIAKKLVDDTNKKIKGSR